MLCALWPLQESASTVCRQKNLLMNRPLDCEISGMEIS